MQLCRSAVRLLCTVRGCRQPLSEEVRAMVCANGHSFDRARSGYLNLLQPQDRRSRQPGDARQVVEARRRLYDVGHGGALIAELKRQLESSESSPSKRAVLDVGCGEGSILGALADDDVLDGYGVDISTVAVDMAARRFPRASWLVANADRFLPFQDGCFDVALSVTARIEASELARVVMAGGLLLVVVPAPDDLEELRAKVLGEGRQRERMGRVLEALRDRFDLIERVRVRRTAELGREELRDALLATYRGGRRSRLARLAELPAMKVTSSLDLASFFRLG